MKEDADARLAAGLAAQEAAEAALEVERRARRATEAALEEERRARRSELGQREKSEVRIEVRGEGGVRA